MRLASFSPIEIHYGTWLPVICHHFHHTSTQCRPAYWHSYVLQCAAKKRTLHGARLELQRGIRLSTIDETLRSSGMAQLPHDHHKLAYKLPFSGEKKGRNTVHSVGLRNRFEKYPLFEAVFSTWTHWCLSDLGPHEPWVYNAFVCYKRNSKYSSNIKIFTIIVYILVVLILLHNCVLNQTFVYLKICKLLLHFRITHK